MRSQHRALQIDTFHSDAYIVQLRGELDLAGCLDVELALEEAERSDAKRVYLDIEGLTFLDSCGLNVLRTASHRSVSNGDRLRITQGKGQVARLFKITDLEWTLPFTETHV
jgi:anti-anti-sigma factor